MSGARRHTLRWLARTACSRGSGALAPAAAAAGVPLHGGSLTKGHQLAQAAAVGQAGHEGLDRLPVGQGQDFVQQGARVPGGGAVGAGREGRCGLVWIAFLAPHGRWHAGKRCCTALCGCYAAPRAACTQPTPAGALPRPHAPVQRKVVARATVGVVALGRVGPEPRQVIPHCRLGLAAVQRERVALAADLRVGGRE